jgi:hypothetical protein
MTQFLSATQRVLRVLHVHLAQLPQSLAISGPQSTGVGRTRPASRDRHGGPRQKSQVAAALQARQPPGSAVHWASHGPLEDLPTRRHQRRLTTAEAMA